MTTARPISPQVANAELASLMDAPDNRSKMARFRDVAATVDQLVRAGVRRSALLRKLADQGLELTPGLLKCYLERWRAAQSRLAAPVAKRPETAPVAVTLPAGPRPSVSIRPTPAPTEPVLDSTPAPDPNWSVREVRNAEVDFASAEQWYRNRQKQRRAERQAARRPPDPQASLAVEAPPATPPD